MWVGVWGFREDGNKKVWIFDINNVKYDRYEKD